MEWGVSAIVYLLPHPHLTRKEAALANESLRAQTWPLCSVCTAATGGKRDDGVPHPRE